LVKPIDRQCVGIHWAPTEIAETFSDQKQNAIQDVPHILLQLPRDASNEDPPEARPKVVHIPPQCEQPLWLRRVHTVNPSFVIVLMA
jgi:hypothetical protein